MSPEPEPGGRVRRIARQVLAEPLTHFLIIGALLVIGAGVVKASQRPVLRIDSAELSQLAAYWELQMQRPPNRAELQAIVRERVDEEVLAREAIRLGLDHDDLIIRRRLAQKMAFANEDIGTEAEPDEAALKAFYEKNRAAYVSAPRLALRHLYFSEDRPGAAPEAAAKAALAALNDGRPSTGDPSVLPTSYTDVSTDELAQAYGPEFAQAVASTKPGNWDGPFKSAYGWHVVRVEARRPGAAAPFASVRDEVREAYLAERRSRSNAEAMERLRRRYRIEVDGAPL
jgi:peptidyl-prolyl cis-trans isomerase C